MWLPVAAEYIWKCWIFLVQPFSRRHFSSQGKVEGFNFLDYVLQTHQVSHVDDIWDFGLRRRRLTGCADGVVDGDGHARLLLTYGATHQTLAGGNWGERWWRGEKI